MVEFDHSKTIQVEYHELFLLVDLSTQRVLRTYPSFEAELVEEQQIRSDKSRQCYLSLMVGNNVLKESRIVMSMKVVLSWFMEILVLVASRGQDCDGYKKKEAAQRTECHFVGNSTAA